MEGVPFLKPFMRRKIMKITVHGERLCAASGMVQRVMLLPLRLDARQGERLGLTKFKCYRVTR